MQAPLQSTSAENMAPTQPLLLLGRDDPKPQDFLWDALRERFRHHLNLEKENRQEMLTSGEQVANFLSGKHFLMPSLYRPGSWVPYQMPNANAQKRAVNITQFYVSNCLFKWMLSNPDVKCDPAINTDEAEQAASGATVIVDRYEREFYKPRKTIQEGLQGICWGSYTWRIFPDTGKQIAVAVREVLENREIELGEGFGQCGECGHAGIAKEFPEVLNGERSTYVCPECDAEAYVTPPARGMVPTVVDKQDVPIFDLSAEIVPFTNSLWDFQFTFDESPWAIIRKRTNLGVIKATYGDVKIPSIGSNGSDIGLDIAEKLAYSGSANAGYSGTTGRRPTLYKEPVTIEEHWMSPGDYADIVLNADTETVSGTVIPKGRLVDTFPDGMLVQGLNEMSVIFGIFKEKHRDYTTQGVWYSKSMSGAGRGLADLVEVNKIINTDNAQIRNYLRSVSTPAMGIMVGALGDENRHQYVGTPGANVPIDPSNFPEGTKPSEIVFPLFQPQSVPGQMFDLTYNKNNEIAQLMAHITDFSSGLPGVNNKTATGARITQANSNSLFTPPLSVKKEVRQRIAEITVEQYCKHVPIERFFPLKGKYGRMQGVSLKGASIKKDWLQFSVTQDSELPKNSEIKREDYAAFFLAFGNFEMYQMAKTAQPELVQEVERAFGVQVSTEKYNTVEVLCLQRVKQMAQFAQMTDDPQALIMAIQPPVSPMEDEVAAKIKWLRGYLDTDDSIESPPHLRAAIEILITLYYANDAKIATALAGAAGVVEAAAQAPAAIGGAILQQEMGQPEQQEAPEPPPQLSPDVELKTQAEMAKAKLDAKEKGKDRESESKESEAQRKHETEMQKRELANKIAVTKLKPKPKPATKTKTA